MKHPDRLRKKKEIPPEQVYRALQDMAIYLAQGDSIILATKKACRSTGSHLAKAVRATDVYLFMLNKHYAKYGKKYKFIRRKGKIIHSMM